MQAPQHSPACNSLNAFLCMPSPVLEWQRQLLQATALSALLFLGLAFGSDGIRTVVQARDVPASVEPIPALQLPLPSTSTPSGSSAKGLLGFLSFLTVPGKYQYVLLSLGPFQLTRRAVRLGAMAATLSFIVSSLPRHCLFPRLFRGRLLSFMATFQYRQGARCSVLGPEAGARSHCFNSTQQCALSVARKSTHPAKHPPQHAVLCWKKNTTQALGGVPWVPPAP